MSPALFIEPRTSGGGGTTAALGAFILRNPEPPLRAGGGATTEKSGRWDWRAPASSISGGGGKTATPNSGFRKWLIVDIGIGGGGVVNASTFCPSSVPRVPESASGSRLRPALTTS